MAAELREGAPVPPQACAVIIVEHDITRAGLMSVVGSLPGVSVVAEAPDAARGVEMCVKLQPELILADAGMTIHDGQSLIGALRKASRHSSIIALSPERDPDVVIAAIQAGARAFLLRDSPAAELAAAVERVLAGDAFVDRTLAGHVIEAFALGRARVDATPEPDPLTPRELEVLRSVSQGRSNKEIAFDLQLAVGTVKVHVERILRKLSVANRAEATMHAVQLGLLRPGDDPGETSSPGAPGQR